MTLNDIQIYFLCLAGRLNGVPVRLTLEVEKMLINENQLIQDTRQNKAARNVGYKPEILVLACLKYVTYRRGCTVDLDRIIAILNLDKVQIDCCYKHISNKYSDSDLRTDKMMDTT